MNEYYKDLIAAIVEQIKPNDNEEITGQIMQNVLLAIVRHLGDGHVYRGIATPTTVHENSPQGAVFYIATERGMYESFDDIAVTDDDGEIVVLSYDPHLDVWSKASFNITLSAGSVGTAQLADEAVTSAKLGSQAVTQGKIASNAVVTGKLAGKAVTVPKLGNDVWKQVGDMIEPINDKATAAVKSAEEAAIAAATAKTAADAAQQAVGDILIGGVNYINRTNQGTTYWEVYAPTAGDWEKTEAQLLGERGVRISGTVIATESKLFFYRAAQNNTADSYMYDALREGDRVVVSLDADTANIRYINMRFCRAQGGNEAITFDKQRIYITADGIAHYEWHGTVTSYITDREAVVYMHIAPTVAADPMSITVVNMKLERGTKSTAWTPSQLDMDRLGENVVRTTDEQSVTTPMLANNAVTPEKLDQLTKSMFLRTMIVQSLTTAQKEQTLANAGINVVFLDNGDLDSVLPDDVAAKVEAAQLLVVSGTPYGEVLLSHAYTANGIIDFRAVFDNRTVYYVRYTIATKRITSLATTTVTDPNKVSFASAQALTEEQQQQARSNISAMAATPSGDPLHYMYELLGATWNTSTGYWTLDYLSDITSEQMRLIYFWRNPSTVPTANGRYGVPKGVRAIVNMNSIGAQGSMSYMFSQCASVELITFRTSIAVSGNNLTYTFYNCRALEVIAGVIDLHLATATTAFSNAFVGCSSLREVRLFKLSVAGLDLSATSVLSAASVRYLVDNAVNTSPISVGVSHATLANIQGGEGDWAGIAAAAAEKQITFIAPEAGVETDSI